MNNSIILKNGIVVDPLEGQLGKRDLFLENGIIKEIAPQISKKEGAVVKDLEGKTLVPGFVDMHVHLREPGEEEKETVRSGTAAAVAGGVTAVASMPNTCPPVDTPQVVKYLQEKAQKSALARVYPVGTITRGQRGEEMTSYGTLISEGVKAFSEDGKTVEKSSIMYNAFNYLKQFNGLIISHCEEPSLSEGTQVHDGCQAARMGLHGAPGVAEELAVARDILLARATGARLHVAHVSLAKTVSWIKWAKEEGVKITAEVTPHHLLLTEDCLRGFNPMAKMRPPLRTEYDRKALLEGLRSGVIDAVATDHAPHCQEDKSQDFESAPFGVSGLETSVSLLLTELVHPGVISLQDLLRCYSLKPARILGVSGGTLLPGNPADLTVLDLKATDKVDSSRFYSKGRNTPFEGFPLKGRPVMTLVGGEIKMEDGIVCLKQ